MRRESFEPNSPRTESAYRSPFVCNELISEYTFWVQIITFCPTDGNIQSKLKRVDEPQRYRDIKAVKFFIAVFLEVAAFVAFFRLVLPNMAQAEMHLPINLLIWTVLLGLPLSLFEYLYHRYLLHSAVLPFMAAMHRAHSTHHGLTSVKAPVSPNEPEKLVPVINEFAVEEEHQEESMMFPLWSLPIFLAVFLILLGIPLKLIFPSQPMVLAVISTVTLCYVLYEVWHIVLHLPFERFWKPATTRWLGKRVFRRMYSFHLMHHWRPSCNLAIVGFWGVAMWDYAFRTHRRPERIPLPENHVTFHDAVLAQPLWPIRLLDSWKARSYKASRRFERFLARVFLRRETT